MGTISVEKMAGYCLIIGPIVAVLIYFIQPGGVLGIGGQPDPTRPARPAEESARP